MGDLKKQIRYDFANNCFDLLRLFSAFQVMTMHIFRHVRLQETPDSFKWWNGVVILFCISGFLVPASMERSASTWEFLKKRVIRIIPSLWICIIVGVLAAALFCGFTFDKTLVTWFTGQLFFIRDLPQPDFISAFGVGNFQGSLWTMIFTVQFYIITAIIYRFMKNRRLWVWILVFVISVILNLITPYVQATISETGRVIVAHTCFPYFYIYFAGWFMYRYRDKIVPVLTHTKLLCAVLLVARALYCQKYGVRIGEYHDIIISLLLCMLTIGVGYSLGKIRFKLDLSYGLYLYHMVAVDIFVQLGFVGEMKDVIAVYAVSLLLAIASHYLVDNTAARIFKKTESKKFSELEKAPVPAAMPQEVQTEEPEDSDF